VTPTARTSDLTSETYEIRRRVLDSLKLSGRHRCTVVSYRSDGGELLAACSDNLELQGVVAKRVSSRYRPGERSRDWIKAKTSIWREHHAPRRHVHPG
jgi:ATP-dependent DNA ligase